MITNEQIAKWQRLCGKAASGDATAYDDIAAWEALPALLAENERLRANEIDAAVTIGKLNSATPLQDLMKINNEIFSHVTAAEAERDRLRTALTALVDETCDYMLINNLGDPEKKHNIRLARAALEPKS
jgi:hypothetical protein